VFAGRSARAERQGTTIDTRQVGAKRYDDGTTARVVAREWVTGPQVGYVFYKLSIADANHAPLDVVNWTRNIDHFYVGLITDAQLRLITFINPGGYPPGNYRARVTSAGEIVPLEPAHITFTRSGGNALVLTWPEGYQLLTATEVTGPYTPVQGATSPYQVSFTDLRRFFKLVPTQ